MHPSSNNPTRTNRVQASIEACTFNATGVATLARILAGRNEDLYQRFSQQFDAAAFAFLSAGAHNDGNQAIPLNGFYQTWDAARSDTATGDAAQAARRQFRERFLVFAFDVVTMWDRFTGGATLMIHIDGTLSPGMTIAPENLHPHVYYLPTYLSEMPSTGVPLTRIVQRFIEDLGVPVVRCWERAMRARGFPLTMSNSQHRTTVDYASLPLVPSPVSANSTHYVFHGRPPGMINQDRLDAAQDAWNRERSDLMAKQALDATEHQDEIRHLRHQLADRDDQIASLLSAREISPEPMDMSPPRNVPPRTLGSFQDKGKAIADRGPDNSSASTSISTCLSTTRTLIGMPSSTSTGTIAPSSSTIISLARSGSGGSVSASTPQMRAKVLQIPSSPPSPTPGARPGHNPLVVFGPRTTVVLCQHGIASGAHRLLFEIESGYFLEEWTEMVHQLLNVNVAVAVAVAEAILDNSPISG
ncbi:hypothetical protein CERSUDRAFT_73418 [Gelatoporia subvermispora B]|uniref:Uncharacterized protein n=1 Tax=Ceriporiopsis subvermispora (strain B) TaxID=914234 RepID=M2RGG3_CERS8|nr:hypothetical protein CERSUDRAFT_73418 [Gelatoporia subvermispora B]